MYSLTIELPISPTDSNAILGVNKFTKHKVFKKVKEQVAAAVLSLGARPSEPLRVFAVSAVRHSPGTLDYDNFIASLKPFIDALRLSGVIEDDSWAYIKKIEVDQVLSKEKKLVISVKELTVECYDNRC